MATPIKDRFLKAADILQNSAADYSSSTGGLGSSSASTQPSNEEKLRFYALYKQSTVGPCNTPKPGFWDVVARAKWDAWNDLSDMTAEEAMEEYIDEVIAYLQRFPDSPKAIEYIQQFERSRSMGSVAGGIDENSSPSSLSAIATATATTAVDGSAQYAVNGNGTTNPSRPKINGIQRSPLKQQESQRSNRGGLETVTLSKSPSKSGSSAALFTKADSASYSDRLMVLEAQLQAIVKRVERVEREQSIGRRRLPWILVVIVLWMLSRRFLPLVKQLLFSR